MNLDKRIDYIVIWGHGLIYRDNILDLIRKNENYNIIKILYHYPKSIRKLVNVIYSYDYAPLIHLKSKTQYLLNTLQEVLFIFFYNNNPDEDYFGEGEYRHLESRTLKIFKESIRDLFNEKKNDRRTENHVIHASDNEKQTDYILKYLGFNGISDLNWTDKNINLPYYFKEYKYNEINIKKTLLNTLYCNILVGNRENYSTKLMKVNESPHYEGLVKDIRIYSDYINQFLGGPLTEDYTVKRYLSASKNLKYLQPPFYQSFIVVRKNENNQYIILDGLHRATILLASNSETNVPIAILA